MKWTITKNPYNRLVFVGDGENPGYPLFKDCGPSPFNDKCWSDARLIAAAPDMYEALMWAMKHVENVFALANRNDRETEELNKARAALAKAEGK